MEAADQLAEIRDSLREIRQQNDAILEKLDGLMSDLNQAQSGTFASYVVNTLNGIDFMLQN